MKLDREALDKCPDIMSKEQLRIVGHMSKRTALFLIKSKIIPSEYTGKASKCYRIKKKDVIAFFDELELSPKKVIAPPDWYTPGQQNKLSPYMVRCLPDGPIDEKFLRKLYTNKLKKYNDTLTVAEVSDFTGYRPTAVTGWVKLGKLKALRLGKQYIIPKEYLIDWLSSEDYNHIERKSKKHVYSLWWSM